MSVDAHLCAGPVPVASNGNAEPIEHELVEPMPVDAWTLSAFAIVGFIAVVGMVFGFGGWL